MNLRRSRTAIIAFLCAALITGIIGCGGSGEATSPQGQEIERFLKGKNVNSVLWEEWNIMDAYNLASSVYENSNKLYSDFVPYYNQMRDLKNRVAENYADLASISPPLSLSWFWASITDAMKNFNQSYGQNQPLMTYMLNQAVKKNAEAWLSLSSTCRQHDIQMEWPLPRSP